jgi:hypothetical protein
MYTVHEISQPRFYPSTSPRYLIFFRRISVSVTSLSPVHFPGPQA